MGFPSTHWSLKSVKWNLSYKRPKMAWISKKKRIFFNFSRKRNFFLKNKKTYFCSDMRLSKNLKPKKSARQFFLQGGEFAFACDFEVFLMFFQFFSKTKIFFWKNKKTTFCSDMRLRKNLKPKKSARQFFLQGGGTLQKSAIFSYFPFFQGKEIFFSLRFLFTCVLTFYKLSNEPSLIKIGSVVVEIWGLKKPPKSVTDNHKSYPYGEWVVENLKAKFLLPTTHSLSLMGD